MLIIPAIDLKDGKCVRLKTRSYGRRYRIFRRSGRNSTALGK